MPQKFQTPYISKICVKALSPFVIPAFMFIFNASVCPVCSYGQYPAVDLTINSLAEGYLSRAKTMLEEKNYAGTIDQIQHLFTENIELTAQQKRQCDYLLAMAYYGRGDEQCVTLLRDFAVNYPDSPEAPVAILTAADYYFFAHRFNDAAAAYSDLDYKRLSSSTRALYDYRKALSLTKAGLLNEAKPIFASLQENKTYSNAADYYLAYIDYAKGNYEKAYSRFKNVEKKLQSSPEDGIEPAYYIAQIDYERGLYDEVIATGKKLLKKNTSEELIPETERVVGLSYFKTDKYSEAKPLLSAYLAHNDYSHADDAAYALGVINYSEGDYDTAETLLSPLTDLNNDLAQSACLYLGQMAVARGETKTASIYFERAAKMNFDPDVTETAMFNYIAAITHGGSVPFSSSIPVMNEFVSRFPNSAYAGNVDEYLAAAYYKEKDYYNALESIERIKRPSTRVLAAKQKILYELGMENMANSNPKAARDYLKKCVEIDADKEIRNQAYIWLGDAYYALSDYKNAESAYNSYLTNSPRGNSRALAFYGMGYSQMMQSNYSKAAQSLASALKCDPQLSKTLYDDALIRMADAQYYLGNYKTALNNYSTAIANGAAGADYATYRRAVMYGLGGEISKKISELSDMPSRFPNSKWLPDALYEKGQTYTALGDMGNAVAVYEQLKQTYGKTAKARQGMLELAIAYMKSGDEQSAEKTYKEIISNWPTSEEAQLANDDLRQHYAATGELREYAVFLNSVPGAPKINADEMEKLTFDGAETAYSNNPDNISLLQQYVSQYPEGRYLPDALLDIANALYNKGDDNGALQAVNTLLDRRIDSPQAPEALLIKAEILERRGNSAKPEALQAYKQLEELGGSEFAPEAYAGIMRNTSNDSERLKYARLVKNSGGLTPDQMEEATLYEAVALLNGNSPQSGVAELKKLAANPRNLAGAQAAVILGQYYIDSNNVNEAEKVLTAFTDEGTTHSYWLAKGYIALADVYHLKNKNSIAKEYLISLKDNYPGDEEDILEMINTRLKTWK